MQVWPIALVLASGCIVQPDRPAPECTVSATVAIAPGATVPHAAGTDAGYYLSYATGGAWHVEWTCGPQVAANGCDFNGAITFDTPQGGAGATCDGCKAQDAFTTAAQGGRTELEFDAVTATGVEGLDFTTAPGAAIHVDVEIDRAPRPSLVFVPGPGGAVTTPCLPADVVPSAP